MVAWTKLGVYSLHLHFRLFQLQCITVLYLWRPKTTANFQQMCVAPATSSVHDHLHSTIYFWLIELPRRLHCSSHHQSPFACSESIFSSMQQPLSLLKLSLISSIFNHTVGKPRPRPSLPLAAMKFPMHGGFWT